MRKTAMFLMLVLFSQFAFGVNVKDFGAVGNGTTDDTFSINAALATIPTTGGELYFPPGNYKISSTLDLSNRSTLKIRGDGFMSGRPGFGSSIFGDIPGDLVLAINLKSFFIHGISFRNINASSQSALHVEGFTNGVIEWCQFASKGQYGLYAPQNTFTFHIRDCTLNGAGYTGIAILVGGHTTIESCDIVGWNEGIRAFGTTVNIIGCRIEVNKIGLNLGYKPDGTKWSLSRSTITGNSFEANDIAIKADNLSFCTFSGIGMQGSTNAPSGLSQVGISVGFCQWCSFTDIGVGGVFSDKGVKIMDGKHQRWSTTLIKNGIFIQPNLLDIGIDSSVTIE